MFPTHEDRQDIAADILAPAVARLMDALDAHDEAIVEAYADEAMSALRGIRLACD